MIKLFLSYHFVDDSFIRLVSYYLGKQETLQPYCWTVDGSADGNFPPQIRTALLESDVFLLFLGEKLGETQIKEVNAVIYGLTIEKTILIKLGAVEIPDSIAEVRLWDSIPQDNYEDEDHALACARTIVTQGLQLPWREEDGVPEGYAWKSIEGFTKGLGSQRRQGLCRSGQVAL